MDKFNDEFPTRSYDAILEVGYNKMTFTDICRGQISSILSTLDYSDVSEKDAPRLVIMKHVRADEEGKKSE